MTYTFKLARRLARFRAGGLLVTLLTLACAGGESPIGPELDPASSDPTSIDVVPDTASVGVDGEVQFDAEAVPTADSSASYWAWWRGNRVVSVRVNPDSIKLAPGATRTFSATGKTSYGSYVRLSLTWKATGGTVSEYGRYVAGKAPGNYIVVASTSNGLADTAKVVVTGSGSTTTRRVVLAPASVSLSRGEQQRFSVTGAVSDGSSFSVEPAYAATGGSVSSGGTFTAGQTSGNYRVIANDRATGLADTSAVTIVTSDDDDDDPVASVTVSPASAVLTQGQTQQLSATVRDQAGNTLSSATVSWISSNTGTATVSSAGLVRAVAAGNVTITASSGGKQDDAAITITGNDPAPPPPPPGGSGSFAVCENLPAADRTVNVSSQSALASALSNAQPGDRIVLAAGTYSGNKSINSRSGTQAKPIVLCGPRTAVLTGDMRPTGISWWIFQGFTMRDGFQSFYATRSSNNKLRGLEIYNVGQEAVHFRCGSSDNVIQGNWIHDTGRSNAEWGEAIYIGSWVSHWSQCGSGPDQSDRNQILDNKLGPNVRAEHLEIKEGTTGGVIRGNTIDGSGMVQTQSWNDSWAEIKGNDWVIEDNQGSKTIKYGFQSFVQTSGWGNRNVFRGNRVDQLPSGGMGFQISGGSGNVVACDNAVTGGQLANVSCR